MYLVNTTLLYSCCMKKVNEIRKDPKININHKNHSEFNYLLDRYIKNTLYTNTLQRTNDAQHEPIMLRQLK